MGVKRKTYRFRRNDIIEVEEFHDGRYGAPGERRSAKRKPTPEQVQQVNAREKAKRCRHRLLEYFTGGDLFATLTYEVGKRPENMEEALKDFSRMMTKVRKEYKKRGKELFWIRNIERGTKGAWHIHLVINETGDTASILEEAWRKGGIYICTLKNNSRLYSPDFAQLASYMTKDEHTVELKNDGQRAKRRISESSYSTSRNMPLPEPKVDKLKRWKNVVTPKKGYVIDRIYEGVNPVTGYLYRRYTMVKGDRNGSKHLYRNG